MVTIETTVKNLSLSKPQRGRMSRSTKGAALQQCLIVASDPARQSMFVEAASDAGFETLIAADASAALALLGREFVAMAVVDVEGHQAADFHNLFDRLRKTNGLLSMVCGNEGDEQEEVYVRQASPWLYLPGVQLGAEFSTLCQQARQLIERTQVAGAGRAGAARGLRRSG
jgi:CheY-like chemotaxis protein